MADSPDPAPEQMEATSPAEVAAKLARWADAQPGDDDQLADLAGWLERLIVRCHQSPLGIDDAGAEQIARLYGHLPKEAVARHLLLKLLATDRSPAGLRCWAALISQAPPASATELGTVFAPLAADLGWQTEAVFPALLAGLQHPETAPLILDLANLVYRSGSVSEHPAAPASAQIRTLLSRIADHLDKIHEQTADVAALPDAPAAAQLRRQIAESVPLAVSCCHTLGLVGDEAAIPSLYKALGVAHRRLRIEAAFGLTKLHEETGLQKIVELAAEPIVRSRALAYASELGRLDDIPPEYRSDQARAEATFVQHIAEPTQYGTAPTHCELLDYRELYWPGFDEPVPCWLFAYTYHSNRGDYHNVGLVGPTVRAPIFDLSQLELADIYAYFAGWQTEHDEIQSIEPEDFSSEHRQRADQLQAQLPATFHLDSVRWLARFFDEFHLVGQGAMFGRGKDRTEHGTIVIDAGVVSWFTHSSAPNAPSVQEHYDIYKGRRLLQTFNPDEPF